MKKVVVVMMLALCIAGCRNNKKQEVFTQSDLKQDIVATEDIDWIGLYVRSHELDSLKNLAEAGARSMGQPMPALPDSVGQIWSSMLNEMLMQNGDNAFGLFESHRKDIEDYLRLDFIYYGFITKVYLPYKAMRSTREEYGEICIKELQDEYAKAETTIMYTGQVPSHYDNLLKDLYYAYLNYGYNDAAMEMCDRILRYLENNYGEENLSYVNMLSNKAHLCGNMGNIYSAMVAAKRAIILYDKIIANPASDEVTVQSATEEKKKLEDKLQQWQGKK